MNQQLSLTPRRILLASQVARGITQGKISHISQKVSLMRVSQMILAATFALAMPEQSLSQEISDDRIKALVAETLRENPELVIEALQALEARQAEVQAATAASVLTEQRGMLERDPNAPILGNPDGDVTIVEFFDYNCPYCKRAMPEVNALMAEDTNVRLVLREWPILSEGSAFAARAALASRQQGKYAEMHDALMTMRGKVEAEAVLRIAGEVGLDVEKLKIDMQSPEVEEHIATSMRLAEALGFNGTPSFVVGDQLIPGFVEKPELVEAVTAARAAE
jgi:protein-disulfide isomerase